MKGQNSVIHLKDNSSINQLAPLVYELEMATDISVLDLQNLMPYRNKFARVDISFEPKMTYLGQLNCYNCSDRKSMYKFSSSMARYCSESLKAILPSS